ncbi:MAG: hypothetical protein ACKO96_47105 [Flammeovirgaceae bacterium]
MYEIESADQSYKYQHDEIVTARSRLDTDRQHKNVKNAADSELN